MQEPASIKKELHFRYLPGLAEYILKNRLHEFVRTQLRQAIGKNLPMLRFYDLTQYTEEELVQLSMPAYTEFLNFAARNELDRQIDDGIKKWLTNQLPNIQKEQLLIEDITLSSHLRKKGFYEFITEYTSNVKTVLELVKEIEEYSLALESRLFAVYVNIREEKMNEINLATKKNKQKLLEAQEIAKIGSFEWNLTQTGKSEYTPQVYKIFEMETFTDLGDFFNFIHPEDQPKVKAAIERATGGETECECEYRYLINGKQKVIWSHGKVERENGQAVVLKGTIMDITDRHDILQSLDQKNKELKRSNEELTSFSYVASHDLQEPLRKIKTFSNILLEKERNNLSEDGKLYLSKIDSSTMRMQKLIHDLLAFSRTQTNVDSKQKVDLNTVIEHIRHSYDDMIHEKRLVINSARLPEIFAVPFQAQQLFENVIGNSVKYRKPSQPAVVDIQLEEVNNLILFDSKVTEYFKISVKDNGIGFDNKYSEKIFEIFHRLHGKSEYTGTGIGLAICKKIVENHGGFMKAHGTPEEGATFEIYFPKRAPGDLI